MVAEDRAGDRLLIATCLRGHGHIPDLVENGALAVAAAIGQPCGWIVMDSQIRELDGDAATRAIRRHGEGGVPARIFALTANAFSENRGRCREAGRGGFLTNPINIQQLLQAVQGESPNTVT